MQARLHGNIDEIGAAAWDACAGGDNPFVSYGFLSALEISGSVGNGTGWMPRYLSITDEDGHVAAVAPLYVKTHSYGEYVFDQNWAEVYERAGGDYYPKLQICVPFSPVPGPRLIRRNDGGVSVSDIAGILQQVCAQMETSSLHVTFCNRDEYDALGQAGWLQRLGTQFHWHNRGYKNFDEFLGALSANHRKSIRRERRDAQNAGLTFRDLRGAQITQMHWDAFFDFYQATSDRKWGSAYLTRAFFTLLAERLGDRVLLMLAEKDGVPVAGALNLIGGDTLYGRNWGCIGEWPFLHFELCYYRAIDFAIAHGLKTVEAGAQGAHKIQRGYLPQPTYSAHWIAHEGLAQAVANYLRQERAGVQAEMEDLATLGPFKQT